MSDDGNNPFSNYETAEHKISGDNEVGPGGSGPYEPRKQHIEFMGTPVSTGNSVVGLAVLIIGIIIGIAVAGEQETAMECFAGAVVVIASIVVAISIWTCGGKARKEDNTND